MRDAIFVKKSCIIMYPTKSFFARKNIFDFNNFVLGSVILGGGEGSGPLFAKHQGAVDETQFSCEQACNHAFVQVILHMIS